MEVIILSESCVINNEFDNSLVGIPKTVIAVNKPKPFFNHNPDAYASEMKESDQWLYSHLKPKADGTYSKPPCDANGFDMNCNDPNNLTSFEIAFPTCKANLDKLSGLGFSIQPSSPIRAIDMNHVFEGEWNQQALDELGSLNTRVEWSPSHTGVHVFFTCPIMPNRLYVFIIVKHINHF